MKKLLYLSFISLAIPMLAMEPEPNKAASIPSITSLMRNAAATRKIQESPELRKQKQEEFKQKSKAYQIDLSKIKYVFKPALRASYEYNATYEGREIGYIEFTITKKSSTINLFFVKKMFRSKGVGAELFKRALNKIKELKPNHCVTWEIACIDDEDNGPDNAYDSKEYYTKEDLVEMYKSLLARIAADIPHEYKTDGLDNPKNKYTFTFYFKTKKEEIEDEF